ncbi:hypothetical protein [Limosilactobacillus caccae]|uniref:hypothetical protein n=1 Tax=Limosilactobacillus caccae TaxID=1926284 RepID=UPI001F3936BE|nr:hypothetical protein [Limosilactobacillus caccae]
MEEQNEIIKPVFKSKPSNFKKHGFNARPAIKVQVNDVELTIYKGANSILATDNRKSSDSLCSLIGMSQTMYILSAVRLTYARELTD